MSTPALALPRATPSEPELQIQQQQSISALAYALWQQRGCPDGTSEQDWAEAEGQIARTQQASIMSVTL